MDDTGLPKSRLMEITFDVKELMKVDRAFAASAKTVSDKRVAGSALRKALAPTLAATRRLAPVGGNGAERISLKKKGPSANDYRRGGATRRDQRIKIVPGQNDEVVRGLVGTSKARGHVGWRTHLITRYNKNRRGVDDFIGKAFDQTINQVVDTYGKEMTTAVEKIIKTI